MKLLEIVAARNVLYHVTTEESWNHIKSANKLNASIGEVPKPGVTLQYEKGFIKSFTKDGKTYDVADWKKGDFLPVIRQMVHVTRNKNAFLHMNGREGRRVIIILDVDKLRAGGYVIAPRLGDFGRSSEKHYAKGRAEAEEIVYKKDDAFSGITNLSKYIVDAQVISGNDVPTSIL